MIIKIALVEDDGTPLFSGTIPVTEEQMMQSELWPAEYVSNSISIPGTMLARAWQNELARQG